MTAYQKKKSSKGNRENNATKLLGPVNGEKKRERTRRKTPKRGRRPNGGGEFQKGFIEKEQQNPEDRKRGDERSVNKVAEARKDQEGCVQAREHSHRRTERGKGGGGRKKVNWDDFVAYGDKTVQIVWNTDQFKWEWT